MSQSQLFTYALLCSVGSTVALASPTASIKHERKDKEKGTWLAGPPPPPPLLLGGNRAAEEKGGKGDT